MLCAWLPCLGAVRASGLNFQICLWRNCTNISIVCKLPVFIKLWGSPGMDTTEKATRGWSLWLSSCSILPVATAAFLLCCVSAACNEALQCFYQGSATCTGPNLLSAASTPPTSPQNHHFTPAQNCTDALHLESCVLQGGHGAEVSPWAVSPPQPAFGWSGQPRSRDRTQEPYGAALPSQIGLGRGQKLPLTALLKQKWPKQAVGTSWAQSQAWLCAQAAFLHSHDWPTLRPRQQTTAAPRAGAAGCGCSCSWGHCREESQGMGPVFSSIIQQPVNHGLLRHQVTQAELASRWQTWPFPSHVAQTHTQQFTLIVASFTRHISHPSAMTV